MEDNVNSCELEQDNVLKVIEQAADELDEDEVSSIKWHEKTVETTSVRAILKRQKEGKIKLPLCQRLYIWNEAMRRSLFESVERNYPCGAIILAELTGKLNIHKNKKIVATRVTTSDSGEKQ